MPEIIASSYEIIKPLGSGGGGVVYLAQHLRLKKFVVLKADKRTLSSRPETLRREVDALKDLSHTYIPQVYDFVAENGTVYTVMDYIEGESLDKPLKRGQSFSQAQVIEWGCELLEALHYLHTRPPHGILHADIKPANIMVTPQGDIRLIDFNIALHLKEEGAVRVGFSNGYASPEHYGLDYSGINHTRGVTEDAATQLEPESAETVWTGRGSSHSESRNHPVLLDVRSDIYSLGATLYHLLTGVRPERDAADVTPIKNWDISPAVADIIQKAMAPDPAQRYQTAAEMLYAFEHLHENDPRTKRHKRTAVFTAAVLSAVFLAGGMTTFVGLKQMERLQNAYVLAEYSTNALQKGDVELAVAQALEALPEERGIFDPPYTPQAQTALADALGVYDLSDGFKVHRAIELSSEPLKVAMSPVGTRTAVLLQSQICVFDTESGEKLVELPAQESALSDVVFQNESVLIYAGAKGITAYDLSAKEELWQGNPATSISLSEDGSIVAAVYKDENQAVIYDSSTGEVLRAVTFQEKQQAVPVNDIFADPEDNLFLLDGSGRWLAVSFSDGSLELFDLHDSQNNMEFLYDAVHLQRFEGGFYGSYFAMAATNADGTHSVFNVIDTDTGEIVGSFPVATIPYHVRADADGICVSAGSTLVQIDLSTGEQIPLAYTFDKDISDYVCSSGYTLTLSTDGTCSFFDSNAFLVSEITDGTQHFAELAGNYAVLASRDVPTLRVMKREEYSEATFFTYYPDYDHDEARLSADGTTVMLFSYRGFSIFDMSGTLLAEMILPDAEQIYDQKYQRNEQGSYLEVIYYDGTVRSYSAADGTLLSETSIAPPDDSLYEEFFTDRLRITSPLHGTPAAYDRETGELVSELEKDAYLTYVTQAGELIITEYISADGERYGLLLNEECQILAKLPDLCDVTQDGTLVFDDMRGNLRQSRIYSIQELITLAKNYEEEKT